MVKNESSHLLVKTNRLKVFEKLMYGLGHVHNDLCAALWFSYGLIYFQIATNPNGILPGLLIFIGKLNINPSLTVYKRNYKTTIHRPSYGRSYHSSSWLHRRSELSKDILACLW